MRIITMYAYFLNWRLVSYVRRRTRSASRPCHDVASPSNDMDRFKAEVRVEAGFGGADVPAHSGPIEEQPTT